MAERLGWRRRLLFTAILAGVAVLSIEIPLQLYYRISAGEWLFRRTLPPIYEADPFRCYRVKADLDYVHRTNEFAIHLYTNAQSFRTDARRAPVAYEKPADVYRVLFLGPLVHVRLGQRPRGHLRRADRERAARAGQARRAAQRRHPRPARRAAALLARARGLPLPAGPGGADLLRRARGQHAGGLSRVAGLSVRRGLARVLRAPVPATARDRGAQEHGDRLLRLLPLQRARAERSEAGAWGPARSCTQPRPRSRTATCPRWCRATGASSTSCAAASARTPRSRSCTSRSASWCTKETAPAGSTSSTWIRSERGRTRARASPRFRRAASRIVDTLDRLIERGEAERQFFWLDIHLTPAGNLTVTDEVLPVLQDLATRSPLGPGVR